MGKHKKETRSVRRLAGALFSCIALLSALGTVPAHADGTTVITSGPAEYTLGFTHPTGTLAVGGGTVSARCAAVSAKGSPVFATPRCTTRQVTCPVTATSCSLAVNFQENALRGPVAFVAGIAIAGGFGGVTTPQPYNCPGAYNCGWRLNIAFLAPGTIVQAQILNISSANFPSLFAQTTLTVH
jgi:hypothetical protein